MGVLAKHVDRLDTVGRLTFILLFAGALVVIIYLTWSDHSTTMTSDFLFLTAFVLILFPEFEFSCWKEYNFKKLKNFLSEEEARTFLPYGFLLECHDELPMPMDHRLQGYYLHFIPSTTHGNDNNDMSPPELSCQRGYLRVQVVKGGLCSWNTSPALPFYDYLPDGIVAVSLADWSEFWSKMDILSSTAMSSFRRLHLIVWLYMLLALSTTFVNDIVALVFHIVRIALLLLGFYCSSRARAIDSDIQNVCNEYADQFEEQGVYMEFRREHDWTDRSCLTVGGIFRRYIYLFPIQRSSQP
jgi:hypothetical protein